MKTYGSFDNILKSIRESTDDEIRKAREDFDKRAYLLEDQYQKHVQLLDEKASEYIEQGKKTITQTILQKEHSNQQILLQKHRERLITAVMKEVEARLHKLTKTKRYIDHIRNNIPQGRLTSAYGSSKTYKKYFTKMKLDTKINGIRLVKNNIIYDFSVELLMSAYKDKLREMASKVLFE